MWSNLKVNVPAPAVAERISTMRSPISASGILARTISQPSQPSRVSKPRIWPHRLALRQAFGNADTAGRAERHVGGIHRVVRAVDQCDLKIDHRKTKRPVLERIDDTFLNRGDVV